jgi:hypothetical protein
MMEALRDNAPKINDDITSTPDNDIATDVARCNSNSAQHRNFVVKVDPFEFNEEREDVDETMVGT